jgi:hypothetical protein
VLQQSDVTLNIPTSAAAGQTVPVSVTLSKPLPIDQASVVAQQFYPDPKVAVSDPTVAFSANANAVIISAPNLVGFPLQPNATSGPPGTTLNVGTTAGDIVVVAYLGAYFRRQLTPAQAPYRIIHIDRAAPVIQNLTAASSGSGVTLSMTAFSTSRDLTQAVITLTAAPGVTLATNTITVPLASAASAWYGSSQSQQYGTQFGLSIPINLGDGAKDVTSVSVTLANSVGTSAPATAAVTLQ